MKERKRNRNTILMAAVLSAAFSVSALGAFNDEVEKGYNTAVQAQDALDGLDVETYERTVSSRTNISSEKDVTLKVSGIKDADSVFAADILVKTDEGEAQSYYRGGYYYEEAGGEQIKTAMDRETIWNRINSHIYLDMTSNYLKLLYASESESGGTYYSFAATDETLEGYKVKLLDAYTLEQGAVIDAFQGSMDVDPDGHVLTRTISMVYSVGEGENAETFHKTVMDVFNQNGDVTVDLPSLAAYEKQEQDENPAVTITPLVRTAYVTADVNVRAAGSLEAAIIGGYAKGSGIAQTGVTSDGWVQIQYNGSTGYIWGELVSATKPVFVSDSSGVMYATADVNIRSDHSADAKILGVLRKGQSVTVTGLADNGWVRVDYLGNRAYVAGNYLSRSEPVDTSYVKNASISGTVTDASYGTLVLSTSAGTLMFNTQYASFDMVDGLDTGDWVTVVYSGSGSPYTASSVKDATSHSGDGQSSLTQMYTIDGVVSSVSGNALTLSCSDGTVRTFDLANASVEVPGGLASGEYVLVSWMSADGSERSNIAAVAVS